VFYFVRDVLKINSGVLYLLLTNCGDRASMQTSVCCDVNCYFLVEGIWIKSVLPAKRFQNKFQTHTVIAKHKLYLKYFTRESAGQIKGATVGFIGAIRKSLISCIKYSHIILFKSKAIINR
jgi:hypothetical protein